MSNKIIKVGYVGIWSELFDDIKNKAKNIRKIDTTISSEEPYYIFDYEDKLIDLPYDADKLVMPCAAYRNEMQPDFDLLGIIMEIRIVNGISLPWLIIPFDMEIESDDEFDAAVMDMFMKINDIIDKHYK